MGGLGEQNLKQFPIIFRLLDLYICMKSLSGNLTVALSCHVSIFKVNFQKQALIFKIEIVCACSKCRANEVDELGSDGERSLDAALCLPKNMTLYIIYEVHTLIRVFMRVKNSDAATRRVSLSAICYIWTYVGSLQNPVRSHHYYLLSLSSVVLAHLRMVFLWIYCRALVLNWQAWWNTHFNKKKKASSWCHFCHLVNVGSVNFTPSQLSELSLLEATVQRGAVCEYTTVIISLHSKGCGLQFITSRAGFHGRFRGNKTKTNTAQNTLLPCRRCCVFNLCALSPHPALPPSFIAVYLS